jgi:DNA (cytosine-5)-methyltransferase 1
MRHPVSVNSQELPKTPFRLPRGRSHKHLSNTQELPHVVSLFSGAGALDWGFSQNGFDITLAIDKSPAAIETHKKNLPAAATVCADLASIGSNGVREILARHLPAGAAIGIIGGPPCQGFSRANAASRSDDPRNTLVKLYLDIVTHLNEHYRVDFIVFENVLGIRDQKHASMYNTLLVGLRALDLVITEQQLCALDFGVPQVRNRVIIAGLAKSKGSVIPKFRHRSGSATLEDAISHLEEPAFFERELDPLAIPTHPNHWTMRPRSPRFSESPASWRSGRSFRRTFWEKASPTIAFGHREIYVHPSCARRLSIYEAMLLQGFPPTYVLEGNLSEQVEQVSNAVPPPVAHSVASSIRRALRRPQP